MVVFCYIGCLVFVLVYLCLCFSVVRFACVLLIIVFLWLIVLVWLLVIFVLSLRGLGLVIVVVWLAEFDVGLWV